MVQIQLLSTHLSSLTQQHHEGEVDMRATVMESQRRCDKTKVTEANFFYLCTFFPLHTSCCFLFLALTEVTTTMTGDIQSHIAGQAA